MIPLSRFPAAAAIPPNAPVRVHRCPVVGHGAAISSASEVGKLRGGAGRLDPRGPAHTHRSLPTHTRRGDREEDYPGD